MPQAGPLCAGRGAGVLLISGAAHAALLPAVAALRGVPHTGLALRRVCGREPVGAGAAAALPAGGGRHLPRGVGAAGQRRRGRARQELHSGCACLGAARLPAAGQRVPSGLGTQRLPEVPARWGAHLAGHDRGAPPLFSSMQSTQAAAIHTEQTCKRGLSRALQRRQLAVSGGDSRDAEGAPVCRGRTR